MEELIEIMEEINPDVDYAACTGLIDEGIWTSFDLVMLITEIREQFGVAIPAERIVPENFNSAEAVYALIKEMEEDD